MINMEDKLTELLIDSVQKNLDVHNENGRILDLRDVAKDLLNNGVILPPCKVGDTVWNRNIEPHKVISIEWYSPKVMHLHCEHHTFSVGKRSLGKTVFLTREEAEKALGEKEDDN